MKDFYYYYRDEENKPIVTVCILIDEKKSNDEKNIARGVAICSDKDIPCKKTGRKIAFQRALHAFLKGRTTLGINTVLERNKRISKNVKIPFKQEWIMSEAYKSVINPFLTEYERKIINPQS